MILNFISKPERGSRKDPFIDFHPNIIYQSRVTISKMSSLHLVLVYANINNVHYFLCISTYSSLTVADDRDPRTTTFHHEAGRVIPALPRLPTRPSHISTHLISLIDGQTLPTCRHTL